MSSQPWLDGLWYYEGSPNVINDVTGEDALWRNLAELDYPDYKSTQMKGVWTHGKFQETMKEIEEITGAKNYDIEMKFFDGAVTLYGVLSEDGTSIVLYNMLNHLDTIRWMTPEKKQEVLDARVHEDSLIPPGFTPQPENQGKILFLSGPPGAGKSTTAQYLAKEMGWVYYEADCYGGVVDPFIPLEVDEPSLAQMKQKPIKGRTVEGLQSMDDGMPEFKKMIQGAPYDDEKIKPFYRHLAEDIVKHKQRLGGNFAVAQAVPKREMRDFMKEVFGPQGIFVTIRLSKETNAKRIEARHGGGDPEMIKNMTEWLNKMYDLYEDAQPGEENCVTVEVDPDDSREDVMKKILQKVDELEETMTEPKQRWEDGLWYFEGSPNSINKVTGGEARWLNLTELDYPGFELSPYVGSWTYGKYHETLKEIEEKTGAKHYDLEMKHFDGAFTFYGVLSEDGKSVVMCNMLNQMDTIRLMTPEKQEELLASRPHQDSLIPPGCTPQPENQGKILFLSGPPGAGKSTTAQFLAKEKGFVYYEADCFPSVVDPFIPLDVPEPSMAQLKQSPIKGRTLEDLQCLKETMPEFQKMIKLAPYDVEQTLPMFRSMAKDVVRHKERLGGNFAIAQAVAKRAQRECMKEIFGPQGIFVLLKLSKETNAKRIEGRHAGGDPEVMKSMITFLNGLYDTYEDTQPGEENCITVNIGPDDSREDVMNKILKQVDELEASKSKVYKCNDDDEKKEGHSV